ncbi:MAG: hypothetical protein EBY17_24880 [Acidobacteriia bacterium]|nr:hypothetical protein [Terriglobia bacterium]
MPIFRASPDWFALFGNERLPVIPCCPAWVILPLMELIPPAFITPDLVASLAGPQTFKRGHQYFATSRVTSLDLDVQANDAACRVHATVEGDRKYLVTLTATGTTFTHSCDCPMGEKGDFCKHCVAAALAWLKVPKIAPERLLLYAARRTDPATAASTARKAFQDAVRVRGYVGYRGASSWARDVDRAIDLIEQLLTDGQAAEVIPICESALKSLASAVNHIDDSDGHFGSLSARLHDLHFQACTAAPPDPAALATRLFKLEFTSDYDVFHGAAQQYAQILGPLGLRAYRKLAEKEWAKVPVRGPGDRRSDAVSYFAITHIMKSLALACGDREELVAVMSRDLSVAWRFVEIATIYRDADDFANALLWAERGLAAFPQRTDYRLRSFLVQQYHACGRHQDAMNLAWAEFADHLSLEKWKLLEANAEIAHTWPEWRERALAFIRNRQLQAKVDHSLLVEIFLYEGHHQDAWHEANTGGCYDSLWLRLAALRAADYPAEAAAIYLRQATLFLAQISDGRYEETVTLLCKTASLMRRLGRSDDFAEQLVALRAQYKAKRNFTKLLDEKREALA